MIRIIKEGVKPQDIVYYKKCPICKTKFTFSESDMGYDIDWYDIIQCPYCNNNVMVGFKRKYKEKKHGKQRI